MADQDDLIISISTDLTTVKRALTKLVGDVGSASDQISKKFDAAGKNMDKSMTSALQSRIDSMVGIGTKGANEWNGALADQGKQLDALRAKYNPVLGVVRQYQAAQSNIKTLYASGTISVNEYTSSLSKQRQAALASISAIKGHSNAVSGHGSSGLDGGQMQALLHSARSITEQLALGVSPTQAFVGQLSHLSYVAGGEGGVTGALKAVGGGILGVVSKFPLISTAIAAVGVATAIYYATSGQKAKSLTDAMADQEQALKRIVAAYGSVAESAAKAGSAESKRLADSIGARSQAALTASTKIEAGSFFSSKDVGTARAGGRFGQAQSGFVATVPAFQDAITKLQRGVKAGKGDFDEFYESIARKVELDPSLAKAGDKAIAESDKLKEATDALKEYQRIRDAIFNDRGKNGMLLSQGTTNTADAGNYEAFKAQQRVAAARSSQAFAAQTAGINARSPLERANAARLSATAQYSDETPDARRQRIQQAGTLVEIQSQHDLAEAQRDRAVSLNKTIEDQKLEISLIGKTSGETATLRKEYDLTSQLRIDAAKNGTEVDQKEIDLIKAKSKELGALTEAYGRAKLANDLSYQRDQFGRSPTGRAVADQLHSAGLTVDLLSKSAFDIAKTNRLQIDQDKGYAQESFKSQVQSINAVTAAERVAAARSAAKAQHISTEPDDVRQQRIKNAGLLEQERINQELDNAELDRERNLKSIISQQKQDIALIGKTGSEAAAATQQYQLMAQLRAEASKRGIDDEKEFQKVYADQIQLIKQTSDQYGLLAEARSKAQLSFDLTQKARIAALDPQQQQVVQMQRQYGLPEDPNSDTGHAINKSIDAQANRDAINGFLTEFKDGIVKNGDSVGKAFGTALQNALMKQADKLWDKLFNQVANAILGTGTGSGADGNTGGVAGLGASAMGRLLSPKSIASQAIPAITSAGTTKTGIDLAKIATSSGLGADVNAKYAPQFQGFIKDLEGTGYKISSIGGYNYRNIAGTNKLSNHAFGDAIDINPQQNPMGKNLVTDLPSNVGDMAAKYGLSWGGAWNSKKDAMHFEVSNSSDASKALDKLAGSAGSATQGLGTFGSGIGQLGQQLGGAGGGIFPAAPAASGGGGLFGWIGSLFSSPFKAAGPQGAAALAGTLKPGLFADGGYTGPGGKNTPAGIVHAGEFVVPKHIVDKIGVPALTGLMKGYADGGLVTPALVSAPSAPALQSRMAQAGSSNGQPGILHVQIIGANGDDHVRTLVKQGVGEGLSQYNTQQRRGGFGTLQNQYANQKG